MENKERDTDRTLTKVQQWQHWPVEKWSRGTTDRGSAGSRRSSQGDSHKAEIRGDTDKKKPQGNSKNMEAKVKNQWAWITKVRQNEVFSLQCISAIWESF